MRSDAHEPRRDAMVNHQTPRRSEGLLSIVVDICTEHLSHTQIPSYRDARLQYYHLKAVAFSVLVCRSVAPGHATGTVNALRYLMDMGLVGDHTLNFYLTHAGELDQALMALLASDVPDSVRLGDLYQSLLALELERSEDGSYSLRRAKHSRDTTGAYYTRPDLAWETTRRAMDVFIEQKIGVRDYSWSECAGETRARVSELLAESRAVDFACGAGEFMCAAVRYAKAYSDAAEPFARCLYGFDVDPVALAVCFRELILEGGLQHSEAAQRDIACQLVLGNPLYVSESEASFDVKAGLFALGRSYATELAVSQETMAHAGRFSLVLGNPPWEKIRFEERRFFALVSPEIATEPNRAARGRQVAALEQNEPDLHLYREQVAGDYAAVRQTLSQNPYIKQIPAGELNTYSLFLVLGLELLEPDGVLALVLKSAIATSPVNSALFDRVRRGGLREIHLFENSLDIFPIDSRERFCILIATRHPADSLEVSFGNTRVRPLQSMETVTVSSELLARINPKTHLLPAVSSRKDFEILASVAGRLPTFGDVFPDCRFGRLLHLTSHASVIHRDPKPGRIPVLEGKLFGQHDLRYATFAGVPEDLRYVGKARARRLSPEEKLNEVPLPRYYVDAEFWRRLSAKYPEDYMVCWRSLTSATNSRTMIASLSPFLPAIQSVQFLQTPDPSDLVLIAGVFNSTMFDSLVRLKIPGIDLTQMVVRQIPVPDRDSWSRRVTFSSERKSIRAHIERRVAQLYLNEPSLSPLFACIGASTGDQHPADAAQLVGEIDALVEMAYAE